MARKNGLPRSTPDLSNYWADQRSADAEHAAATPTPGRYWDTPDGQHHFAGVIPPMKLDPRDFTIVAENDRYTILVCHIEGKRATAVSVHNMGVLTLTEDETDALAQAMLDAREAIRR